MFDLTGKNALITGASGDIGGDIARSLHAAGATVGLSGTRTEPLEALAAERRLTLAEQELGLAKTMESIAKGRVCFVAPLFQEGNGSGAGWLAAQAVNNRIKPSSTSLIKMCLVCFIFTSTSAL